jgi:uncharacterized membrane-anchored protein YjiN (DUF445 family)
MQAPRPFLASPVHAKDPTPDHRPAAPAEAPVPPRRGANSPQAKSLAQMKAIALALLGLAALLYIVATALEHRHPAWPYVAAFGEAAMIGAIADWFAVVALFRHPLGLPIPHTAIIPRNKPRLGGQLANFLCEHFLSTPQVLAKLQQIDPAATAARWLAEPARAARLAEHLASVARYGLVALDDDRVRRFVRRTALAGLNRLEIAPMTGQMLDLLTAERRHQGLLDEVLGQVAALLQHEDIKAKLAEHVAAEVNFLRYVGLDQYAGKVGTAKIVAAVGRVIGEMGDDPEHPLRLRFDAYMADFIERLKNDPAVQAKGEALKHELLTHPALSAYLQGLWGQVLAWLQADLARDESTIRRRIAASAQTLGSKLLADEAMREWLNAQTFEGAPRWIERYREDIRAYVAARVDAWDTRELTDELERHLGRDLQFVRLNGTLVGGLIGVLIHALTQAVRGG